MGHKGTGLAQTGKFHIQRPVFPGLECPDFILPIHHHAGGNGLDTACRQAPAHLLPQQRRKLVAHDPVQNPAGLLGIHQIIVNIPGMGNGLLDHLLGDLVESDTLSLFIGQAQQFF